MKQKQTAKNKIKMTPFVVIIFFLILGVMGIYLDEPSRVLNQATQICLSCIGLG